MSLKKAPFTKESRLPTSAPCQDGHVRYWSASESADADSALPLHMRDERGRSEKKLLSMEKRCFLRNLQNFLFKRW